MDINIVRGTTNFFNVSLTYKETGLPYIPKEGDFAILGVKNLFSDKELMIAKRVEINSDGTVQFKITPEDTQHLKCGKHMYDISVESGEDFYNAVENSPFYISHNVTSKGCAK